MKLTRILKLCCTVNIERGYPQLADIAREWLSGVKNERKSSMKCVKYTPKIPGVKKILPHIGNILVMEGNLPQAVFGRYAMFCVFSLQNCIKCCHRRLIF